MNKDPRRQQGHRRFIPTLAGLVIVLAVVGPGHSVHAKPMMAPTLEEAVGRSADVIVAEYVKYRAAEPIGYFSGPVATYTVVRPLKGSSAGETVELSYAFTDGSACIEPNEGGIPTFKFSETIMPAAGSRWILFLLPQDPGEKTASPRTTYRGDYGRWEATPANLAKVKAALAGQGGK